MEIKNWYFFKGCEDEIYKERLPRIFGFVPNTGNILTKTKTILKNDQIFAYLIIVFALTP